MDQLEYRYVYAGTSVVAYSINPSANEQYILTTGSSGINSPTLPPNTVNCRDYAFNEKFLNEVNTVSRQVYIVQQQQRGFLLLPVIAATQLIRSGSYYLFRAPNYSFAIDTSNMVYESNIATGSSNWYIYFNGLKIRGCYYEYSFKREPTKVSQERSEFDFIPGIGISTERTGMTAVEAENNQYRLVKVNGLALEDYIVARCQGKTASGTAPLSKYTPQVNYGPGAVREGDKEFNSMPKYDQYPAGTTTGSLPGLVNCPDYPGEGYHIVQPGETLNGIARAYNVSVKALVNWNGLKDPDVIQVCQKIWLKKPPVATERTLASKGDAQGAKPALEGPAVRRQDAYWNANVSYEPAPYSNIQPPAAAAYTPPAQALVHVVQKGETLYGIAQRYQRTEADVRRLNNFPA
ncbi:MAG: LysM peptidoglycan-binding domain-containing protein, partial [Saprospiraceae bacterium]|nr:LysM peptidoglycan-binding domain-containing protein [Saprospiraceae bacterium]